MNDTSGNISGSDDLSLSQMSYQVHIRWSLAPHLSSPCSHFNVSFRLLTSQRGPGGPLRAKEGLPHQPCALHLPSCLSVCLCGVCVVCDKHGGIIIIKYKGPTRLLPLFSHLGGEQRITNGCHANEPDRLL